MEERDRILLLARSGDLTVRIVNELEAAYRISIHYSWQSGLDMIDDYEPAVLIVDASCEIEETLHFCQLARNQWISQQHLMIVAVHSEGDNEKFTNNELIDLSVSVPHIKPFMKTTIATAIRIKRLEDQVETMSRKLSLSEGMVNELKSVDSITPLLNLPALTEQLKDAVRRAKRFAEPLSLILVSIDRFTEYSHRKGPIFCIHLLQQVGRDLVSSFRDDDKLARSWGSKFIVLLPESDLTNARKIAERLRARVHEKEDYGKEDEKIKLTLSQGISYFNPIKNPYTTAEDLLVMAEQQLVKAKEIGKGQIFCISDIENDWSKSDSPEAS